MQFAFTFRSRIILSTLAGLLLLTGCGDGDSVRDTGSNPAADQVQLAVDEGAIQGFGSVIVNGTHYESTEAEILVDGQPGTEDDLKLGMVVRVEVGTGALGRDQAPARRILFHSAVQGELESIDAETGSLTLLGFTIATDELTRIYDSTGEAATLADLSPGDQVRISGFRRAAGGLTATYIHADDSAGENVVRGRIADLDRERLRFRLYGLDVDYSGAGLIQTRDRLENGDLVEVEGRLDGSGSGGHFDAERIKELWDRPGPGDHDRPSHGSVQGHVDTIDSGTNCPRLAFSVNGQAVQVTADTRYRNGACEDIEIDRRLVAVGHFAEDGTLIANGVGFPPRINALLRARVEDIHQVSTTADSNGPRCTLRVLEDLFVIINDDTHQGPSHNQHRGYGCRDVTVGQYVFALGHFEATAERDVVTARFLAPADGPHIQDSHPARNYTAVAGQVQRIDPLNRQFEVLGTLVQTDDETDFRNSTAAEFYATTQAGDYAGALGPWTGSLVDAVMAGQFDGEDLRFECGSCDGNSESRDGPGR